MKQIIVPQTNIILTWRHASGMTLPRAMKEIVDNAFDAGATEISIRQENLGSSLRVTVSDNGSGCSNVEAFFRREAFRASRRPAIRE